MTPSILTPSPVTIPAQGNALAVDWMAGFCDLDTPPGYEDLRYTYTSTVTLTNSSPGNLIQNQPVAIDSDSYFYLGEFNFQLLPSFAYSIGDVEIRIRDGRSRLVMEDYCVIDDIAGPIGPCWLVFRPGDTLLYDLKNTGVGQPKFQFQFKGFKRRRIGV